MTESIVVVASVAVIYGLFFWLAHRADEVVKEKQKQTLEAKKRS